MESFLTLAKEHGADGIKLYFASYDTEHAPLPEYAERQTVVLVATKEKIGMDGIVNKDVYVSSEKGNTILAYNVGALCPPYCANGEGNGIGITIVDKGNDGLVIT